MTRPTGYCTVYSVLHAQYGTYVSGTARSFTQIWYPQAFSELQVSSKPGSWSMANFENCFFFFKGQSSGQTMSTKVITDMLFCCLLGSSKFFMKTSIRWHLRMLAQPLGGRGWGERGEREREREGGNSKNIPRSRDNMSDLTVSAGKLILVL